MVRKLKTLFIASAISLSIVGTAVAEDYVQGYGETIAEATDAAIKAAEARVRSRGEGCVGDHTGKVIIPGNVRVQGSPIKENGLYVMTAIVSKHGGSCGQKSRDQQMLEGIAAAAALGYVDKKTN